MDSFHRLAEYHHRYAKLNLPVEASKRVCSGGNAGSLSQLMAQLKMAVRANKSKNTDVLTTAEAVTRTMQGLRFTAVRVARTAQG